MQQALPKSECLAVTTISQPRRLGSSASYFPILTDNEISMYTSKPHRPKFHEYHSSDSVFVTWRQTDMTNFIAKILPLFFATSPKLEYAFSISNNWTFRAWWLLYSPRVLVFKHSTFCSHIALTCFLRISEQAKVSFLYSVKWLVYVTENVSFLRD